MSRWHKSSCVTPDIFINGGKPCCRACGSSLSHAFLEDIKAQQSSKRVPWSMPSNEAPGQLSLYWPSHVPYFGGDDISLELVSNKDHAKSQPQDEIQPLPSHIYDHSLGSEKLRLICLSAADDIGAPIHITLETYYDNDCPEYETTSYTWGGEDNDSTLSKPIFVGPHWDVLLQTQNCWSMLHYLQPRRGIRMVWVDAICINQTDISERETQVAKMADIYQGCLRVVVYLGDDLVWPAQQRHPARYALHKLDNQKQNSQSGLVELLQRRYFSRIWIIQEVVLAPAAAIPLYGKEFMANSITSRLLETSDPLWNWQALETPWLEHIGAGQHAFRSSDLFNMLQRTWRSKATDARDRVFAIVGLAQDLIGRGLLKPDYSLSLLHTIVGAIGNLLLHEKHVEVLLMASASEVKLPFPSWWDRPAFLAANFKHDNNTKRYYFTREGWRVYYEQGAFYLWRLFQGVSYKISRLGPFLDGGSYKDYQDSIGLCLPDEAQNQWRRDAGIHRRTAALSINLFHLAQYMPVVSKEQLCDHERLFLLSSKSCCLELWTSDGSLDEILGHGLNHIFFLEDRISQICLVLFMQETETPGTYTLLHCSPCYDMYLLIPGKCTEPMAMSIHETLYSGLQQLTSQKYCDNIDEPGHIEIFLDQLLRVNQFPEVMRSIFPAWLCKNNMNMAMRAFLPLLQSLLDEARGLGPATADAYLKLFETYFDMKVEFEAPFVKMYLPLDPGESAHGMRLFERWYQDSTSVLDTDQDEARSLLLHWELAYEDLGARHYWQQQIRAEWAAIKAILKTTWIFRELRRLAPAVRTSGENETTMLARGPIESDRLVRLWPEEAVAEMGMDGSLMRVNIV